VREPHRFLTNERVVFVGKDKAERNGGAPKAPRKGVKPGSEDQATVEEFEREGMGVAPKE
jgi:hypothetical protein